MTRRFLMVATILAVLPFGVGCSSMSNTSKDALAGGAIGAGAGAIIDRATGGRGGAGAIIGAASGALIGGAIGNEQDQKEKAALQAKAAATARYLGITEVMQMAREGQSEDIIINQIRTTGSTYQLSAEDLRLLKENAVSDRVIMEMQSRQTRTRVVAVQDPGAVYVVGPPPPVIYAPPPPVGVGVIFRSR